MARQSSIVWYEVCQMQIYLEPRLGKEECRNMQAVALSLDSLVYEKCRCKLRNIHISIRVACKKTIAIIKCISNVHAMIYFRGLSYLTLFLFVAMMYKNRLITMFDFL